MHSRDEKVKVMLRSRTRSSHNVEKIFDVVIEIKFGVDEHPLSLIESVLVMED
jgi:hypothetical protein